MGRRPRSTNQEGRNRGDVEGLSELVSDHRAIVARSSRRKNRPRMRTLIHGDAWFGAEAGGEQGIVVARRTVAKYREALQIPPVAQRKSL